MRGKAGRDGRDVYREKKVEALRTTLEEASHEGE